MAGIQIPVNVIGYQKTKKELEELNNLQERGVKLTKEQAKQKKGLQGALNLANKAVKESVKQNEKLAESYMFAENGMLEVSATISLLEDQMYAMAIAGETNTEQFKEIQAETARLKTVIIETDRSIDTLAENQGLGRVGAGLGIVGERLISLDFAGAGREAQTMAANMSNLGNIGATALKGLTQTVTGLTKAFVKMGVALLANPIFLIAAAFVAIGAAVAALLNALGFLQPIIDAIGAAFGWIAGIIETVIQGLKDFTDWLGITQNAARDALQEFVDGAQGIKDANAEALEDFTTKADQEIRLRQAVGEEAFEIEIIKQKGLIKSAEIAVRNLEKEIDARKRLGESTEEELAALEQNIKEKQKIVRDANNEIEFLNVTHNKKLEDEDKKAQDKRLEQQKQYASNRLAATRLLQDLELQLLDDGIKKDLEANRIKYERLIEDTKMNENLLQSERKAIIDFYKQLQFQEEQDIRAGETEGITLHTKKLEGLTIDKVNAEIEAENSKRDAFKQAQEEMTAKQEEEDNKRKESQQAVIQAGIDATSQSLSAIGDLNNLIFDNKRKNLEKGSAAEIAAAKKQFEINKKIQIAQAVVQGIQSVLAAYSSGSAIPIVGAVTGPLFAALAAVNAGVQVAKIKNQTFEGGGSAPSAPSSGGAGSISSAVQSAAPAFESFASGGTNEAELSDSAEANQQPIVIEAKVSEVEITETQQRINTINENNEL
jgi:hypothetical protein